MTITPTIYDTATLLAVMRQFEPVNTYWLDLCFPGTVLSEDEYIDFAKIDDKRRIAPLVVPTAAGRPIYSAAEKVFRVKPAYVKAKDAVTPGRMIRKRAGLGELLAPTPLSPAARYQAVVADILRTHRDAIWRRWEVMAAEAIQQGKNTLESETYPKTIVDYERDAGHTITLGSGARWGDSGVSILDNIQTWRTLMRNAKFGGVANRITVGTDVWEVMRQDQEIRDLLKVDYRPSNNGMGLNLGLREGLEAEYVGRLSGTLEVWVYSDWYVDVDGTTTQLLNSKDIVLTGPAVSGVKAFGAIQDVAANIQATPIFTKMWDENDPSATLILSQSAPLMIPVNPNATLKARVLA